MNSKQVINIDNARKSALDFRLAELEKFYISQFEIISKEIIEWDDFNKKVKEILKESTKRFQKEINTNLDKFEQEFNIQKDKFWLKMEDKIRTFNKSILNDYWNRKIQSQLTGSDESSFKQVEQFEEEIENMDKFYNLNAKGDLKIKDLVIRKFKEEKEIEFIKKYFSNWKELSPKFDIINRYNKLENILINLKKKDLG